MVLRPAPAATRGFTMVSFTEAVSRRNTFAGGTCAPPSALLVIYATAWGKLCSRCYESFSNTLNTLVLGSCCQMFQVVAPCNVAQGAVCCVWHRLLLL